MTDQLDNQNFSTPILLIVFNRPEKIKTLMEILAKVKPSKLYVTADGPRKDFPADRMLCEKARKIATNVTWPCEVYTNFAAENLGFGGNRGLEAGLDWFFSNEVEGVIFEDDCVPSLDYFRYAQTLLNKYRDEEKVMMICGTNFQGQGGANNASYYFSVYPTWGWATWRRAWSKYDRNMGAFDQFVQTKKIDRILEDSEQKKYWMSFFKKLRRGKFSFMDAKWQFAIWNNEGVCVIPNNNLIQNIGFGGDATNTFEDVGMSMARSSIGEIVHPTGIVVNRNADDFFYNKVHKKSILLKIKFKLRILLRKYFIKKYKQI